ncbi:hypothetical protein MY04_2711 [Flammeovirga sp. MY04]|uniref:putative type IX secretion system sortase PorU2 n=1 Tax=Flammeovirga sp. MY04 TaxID=1191459 RepID=UPI0008064453|nr:C25 family cysteine peptidase [Flammeovirga sp. MY04]ANQ50080.1 hypothetical protein MY04_2711 [Flammeovirga sp. MY04]
MRQAIVFILITLFFFSQNIYSQTPELDSWREKTRSTVFYKMEVRERGIYRVSSDILQAAGYPVSSVNPDDIRIYRRGVEIAIHVVKSGNQLNYVEFYGDRNDGGSDADFFLDPNDHINPYEPIYSRTAVYFISAGDVPSETTPPKRIATSTYTNAGATIPTNHYYTETYRGVPVNGSPVQVPFGSLRTSYCRGHSADNFSFSDNRNKFNSNFDSPRSWTTYNNNNVTGIMSFQLPTVDLADSFNDATIEMRIINYATRSANINITTDNGDGNITTKQNNIGVNRYEATGVLSYTLTDSEFGSSNFTRIELQDSREGSNNTDRNQLGMAYINLTYPQKHDQINSTEDRVFHLFTTQDYKLSVDENTNGRFYDITDNYTPILLRTTTSSGKTEATLQANSGAKKEIIFSAGTSVPTNISEAEFEFTNNNLSSNYLMITHSDLNSAASTYANYRRSPEGGSNSVSLVDIDKLYNTFSWGEQSPLAIRNCIKLLHQNNLEFILLLGKGLDLNYDPYETSNISGERAVHYIPAYGFPGSDVAYTMNLEDENDVVQTYPQIPIGRMSAINNQQLLDYLNKVIEHESLNFDVLWRKKALHLSGGATQSQQIDFKEIVNRYASIFVDTLEGGTVETISRETDGSIEFIDVSDIVNEGIGLMTFFGHSSSESADIDIGEASDPTKGYENQGKYPFIVMSGCGGGNYLTHSKSWGEDWIETPNKGGIGFMAKSGIGSANELEDYGDQFYINSFQKSIGDHIGVHINKVQKALLEEYSNRLRLSHIEQFDMQGDPYVKIAPAQVDFAVSSEEISIIPESNTLNESDDFYKLRIKVNNFGRTSDKENIYIQVNRRYANGQLSNNVFVSEAIQAPKNNTEVLITVTNSAEDKILGFGNNEIIVTVGDSIGADGSVLITQNEISEINNTATLSAQFYANKVNFIYPQKLSVSHENNVNLYAYDYSLDKQQRGVRFQASLDSGFTMVFAEEIVEDRQLFKWNLPVASLADSAVVYVRIRPSANSNEIWDIMSFTKISNSSGHGWMQSSIYQMEQNNISGVTLTGNEKDLTWTYPTDDVIVNVQAGGGTYNSGEFYQVSVNGQTYLVEGECVRSGEGGDKLLFLVFDQNSGEFKGAQERNWGTLQCGSGTPAVAVMFNSTDFRGGNICCGDPYTRNGPHALFIDPTYKFESIEPGDYVLTIMAGSFDFQTNNIPADGTPQKDAYDLHLTAFTEIGLDLTEMQSSLTQPGLAFIGWSRFQMASTTSQTFYATATNQLLNESFTIRRNISTATVLTPPIGPSSLFSRYWLNVETDANDIISTTVFGLTRDANNQIISTDSIYNYAGVSPSNGFDLSRIAAIKNYEEISLKLEMTDASATPTSAQLRNWRVAYEPSPEGVLLLTDNLTKKEIQQGEILTYNYEFHNVSTSPFKDSIMVEIEFSPLNNQFSTFRDTIGIQQLPGNSSQPISLEIDTWNRDNPSKRFSGETEISTHVNPDRSTHEIIYSNNNANERVNVLKDSLNPLIEILFDGARIISGDIVSPSSKVNISLQDENNHINLNDNFFRYNGTDTTTLLQAFIQKQGEDQTYTINLNTIGFDNVGSSNHIMTDFNINDVVDPTLLDTDGTLSSGRYTIEVFGSDPTGNGSGYDRTDEQGYKLRVDFEIVKEAAITNFYPYPNPFSDAVRFVFQITGTSVPEDLKIQIMTVTGRVVKEIFKDELGPIRIGTNISDYAWDGRDEFGDQLANGVYLYRVIIPQKDNGDFKHLERNGDNLFKHQIGKLYLLK